MDLISGCPFWLRKDGQPAAYLPLRESTTCATLVIGAGISGALIAHALADAGIDTIIVDRRDVATGSTAASTALLQYEPDEPLSRLLRRCGEEKAVRCYRACRDALETLSRLARRLGPACRFARRQSLLLASRPRDLAGLKREVRLRRKHGFDVEFWSRRDLAACSSLLHAGALLSREAAVVDAYMLTHALLQDAATAGLRVHERTRVTRLLPTRTGVQVRCEHGVVIRARRVVIAAGYEAQNFLRRPWGSLHSTYALATLPVAGFPGWPDNMLWWETARPYLYARRTHDGRAIIGGYDEPFRDPRARDALLPAKSAALLRRLRALFPAIPAETGCAWTGTFAETPDSLPYIGRSPECEHVYLALGYGGNGIIFSTLAAEIIRDLHLQVLHPAADLFRFDR